MKTVFLAGLLVVAGSLLLPFCQAAPQEQPAEPSPAARRIVSLGAYPLPDRIVEFGNRTEGSIRVMVYGEVKQPGIYYLTSGGMVRDALNSTGGITEFGWWGDSGVLSPLNADQANWYQFTRKDRRIDPRMPLREGDRVYIGHEVY